MKIFKAIKKLCGYLAEQQNSIEFDQLLDDEEEDCTSETTIENPNLNRVREWAIQKIDLLHEADRHRNAKALAAEFDEWINISDENEIEYFYLEDNQWTDEQEIDVR